MDVTCVKTTTTAASHMQPGLEDRSKARLQQKGAGNRAWSMGNKYGGKAVKWKKSGADVELNRCTGTTAQTGRKMPVHRPSNTPLMRRIVKATATV